MARRFVVLLISLLTAGTFLTGVAVAASFGASTSIAIAASGASFTGKVTSAKVACVGNRSIVLKRKTPGQASFSKVGTSTTGSGGGWSIATTVVAGTQYRAVVAAKKVNARTTCSPTASTVVTARPSTVSIV